ncbi:MAG: ROK family protein [Clostridiales bacterium]|nr:ROK family protein [Clostridiales bacterium]
MEHFGIKTGIRNVPELDPQFIPLHKFNEAFLETAATPFSFAIERDGKQVSAKSTFVHGDEAHADADLYYIDRLVKFELWQKGGFRIFVKGSGSLFNSLKNAYSPKGSRSFDAEFFGDLFQHGFEVVLCDELPEPFEVKRSAGGHFDGCRIGLDVGGSDYKASAVIDGKTVYSKETVWNPKLASDPEYHYNGVVSALKGAMAHLPRVDAIGISSAGLIGGNRVLAAQLFQMVPKELFNAKGRDIYIRAVKEISESAPFEVANDGDVAALAGSISLSRSNLLGLAMGTSFIGGFVDHAGNLSNWISELAFAPVDASPRAAMDGWTRDIGVGVQYFCQEAVIKLAGAAGIALNESDTPAEKLKAVQALLAEGSEGAAAIFRTIGCYLGHTVPLYWDSYRADSILLLGRVVSGKGGDIVLETAQAVLREEYPKLPVELLLPDEQTRRLGQSVAAASLPNISDFGVAGIARDRK